MKRIRKSVFIPSLLFIYLAIMAYMGRDKLLAGNYLEYFGILIVTLLCITILFFTMRKQEQIRDRKQRELEEKEHDTPKHEEEKETDK